MTVADLLSRMSVVDNELAITSGGAHELRAITALDMAQDYFESVAAADAKIANGSSTLTYAANTESQLLPADVLRVDDVWYVDPTTSRPTKPLTDMRGIGGGTPSRITGFLSQANWNGTLEGYWVHGRTIYFSPESTVAQTLRLYGFISQPALTVRTQTFTYPDMVSLPIAAFAVRLLEMGIDDPSEELQGLAVEAFQPVLRTLSGLTRTRPDGRVYRDLHFT